MSQNRRLSGKQRILRYKIKTHFFGTFPWSLDLTAHICSGLGYDFARNMWSFRLGLGT